MHRSFVVPRPRPAKAHLSPLSRRQQADIAFINQYSPRRARGLQPMLDLMKLQIAGDLEKRQA
jgi:hypothetical protein